MDLLSYSVQPWVSMPVCEKMKIFQEAINAFKVTIFSKECAEKVVTIFGDYKDKLLDFKKVIVKATEYQLISEHVDSCNDLSDRECTILLWLMNEAPLVVTENAMVYKVLEYCQDKKFVIIGNGEGFCANLEVFKSLSDLTNYHDIYRKVVQNFGYLIHEGGDKITLDLLIEYESKFKVRFTTDELVNIATNSVLLQKEKENLSTIYIPRFLTQNFIDFTFLEKEVDYKTVILISNVKEAADENQFSQFNHDDNESQKNISSRTANVMMMSRQTGNYRDNIFVNRNECDHEDFVKFCEKHKRVKQYHHFRVHDEKLEWIESKGDISKLQNYRLYDNYLKEEEICSNLPKNPINIVIGEPGLGKTELTKSFKNSYSEKFWTVLITPQDSASYFLNKKESPTLQFVDFIVRKKYDACSKTNQEIIKVLARNEKIIFLWDALDEVENRDEVFYLIFELYQNGSIQWITSRTFLKNELENKFSLLSTQIRRFDEKEQTDYINQRLKSCVNFEVNSENVVDKIKHNITFSNHKEILGIPLQLFMLTELFIQDWSNYSELIKDMFSIADLYKHYIEEKFKFFYAEKIRADPANPLLQRRIKDEKRDMYRRYQIIALKVVLNYANINIEDIIQKFEDEGDTFGFITEMSKDRTPIFVHQSYAEYFVASYFKENFRSISGLLDILSNERNNNIRYFFDLLLAEKSRAHRAVLFENFEELKRCSDEQICKDDGGRNVLQLLCSWGKRYPLVSVHKIEDVYEISEPEINIVEKENSGYLETVSYLLGKCRVSDIDDLFKIDSLKYAEKFSCLLTLGFILTKQSKYISHIDKEVILNIMYYSIKCKWEDIVICLIESLNFPNVRTENGKTLLNLASEQGLIKTVDFIVNNGKKISEINCSDQAGWTPILSASYAGHENIVNLLVESGADVNVVNKRSDTLLNWAAYNGHMKICELLIKNDAKIDIPDVEGWTDLYSAAEQGHEDIAHLLIESGAEVNVVNKKGVTPLNVASYYGHYNICKLLLASGAKPNIPDDDGFTAIIWAAYGGHKNIVDLLIKSGAEINIVNKKYATPLSWAAYNGHYDVCDSLLKSGAIVDIRDVEGWTELYSASEQGYEEIVALLIKFGADVNASTKQASTPLNVAALYGHYFVCEILLTCGAEVNVPNREGKTPIYCASENGHKEVVELLIKYGADIDIVDEDFHSPLNVASLNGHYDICNKLVMSGAKVDISNISQRFSPLHSACYKGYKDIVSLLVNAGAEINILDNNDDTPLHWAAYLGHYGICELLLSSGAIKDIPNKAGWTELFSASAQGHEETVELLIEYGSNVNSKNKNGDTPLIAAAFAGHSKICRKLYSSGARSDICNNQGLTAIDYGFQTGS